MVRAIVLDTETTGLKPPIGVCELSYIEINPDTMMEIGRFRSHVNPQLPISPSASGTHRITNDMVADKPTLEEIFVDVLQNQFAHGPVLMIAHNAAYDYPLVKQYLPKSLTLCTLKLARTVYPEAENHKLSTLKYMLNLGTGGFSHSAEADVEDTLDLLRDIMAKTGKTLAELLDMQNQPLIHTVMPFGKHKGVKLVELSSSYISWLVKQPSMDKDLLNSLRHHQLIK